jgi:hypothetical protein
MTFLVLGGTGFLGSYFVKYAKDCVVIRNRLDDIDGIRAHIRSTGIKHFVCAAGIGHPISITDWCETHEEETKKIHYTDVIGLMNLCKEENVHLTYFGSIMNDGTTVVSKWRQELEKVLLDNVLYLRISFPCTFDKNPRCFINKMKNRTPHDKRVYLTIVPHLFPKLPDIILSNQVGILNFYNTGTIHLSSIISGEVDDDSEVCSIFKLLNG